MIKEVKIIFRFSSNGREFNDEFKSIHVFRNYLNNLPERAIQINYIKELPQHRLRQNFAEVSGCKIILSVLYNDHKDEIPFTDAYFFGAFLKANPSIAAFIGYQP